MQSELAMSSTSQDSPSACPDGLQLSLGCCSQASSPLCTDLPKACLVYRPRMGVCMEVFIVPDMTRMRRDFLMPCGLRGVGGAWLYLAYRQRDCSAKLATYEHTDKWSTEVSGTFFGIFDDRDVGGLFITWSVCDKCKARHNKHTNGVTDKYTAITTSQCMIAAGEATIKRTRSVAIVQDMLENSFTMWECVRRTTCATLSASKLQVTGCAYASPVGRMITLDTRVVLNVTILRTL